MGWMAIGTGATAPAFGNTALGAEIDRNALTSATDSANVVTYVGNWAAGDGTNARSPKPGSSTLSPQGRCWRGRRSRRSTRAPVDTLAITWTVTVGTAGA